MLLSRGPSWRPWREQFREFAGLLSVKLRCSFLAAGVEKVRVIKFYTTLVRVRCACSNIDSMEPPFLTHCFKNLERRDFFNSLGQKADVQAPHPLFSGIRWVSELIGIAGGDDCFPELACESLGKNRIIADPQEVIRRAPDIIIGSWCGKKFRPALVAARDGWDVIPAVRDGEIHEVKSALILQPGPAALTDGLAELRRIISNWQSR